ncbi:hypothetical protein LIER_26460 [Lithospermum erythrorhizon]|uniref:Uncharacterized protein n=1 Tax=Lithospermum erythrorhizon TaxID=34254 RepID=A0AAV3R9Q9_LITER
MFPIQTHTKILHNNGNSIVVKSTNDEVPVSASIPPSPDGAATDGKTSPPPGHKDGFRPTTPGHSPGIGHSIHH